MVINHVLNTGKVYIVHQDLVSCGLVSQILKTVSIESETFGSPIELLETLPLQSPACLLVDTPPP